MTRQRIILIDDNIAIVHLLEALLTEAGYDVSVEMEGDKALEKVKKEIPDLVLIHAMSKGSAFVPFTQQIRALFPIPIIIISEDTSMNHLLAAFEAGADDFLKIPFRNRELLARVRALLKRYQGFEEAEDDSRIVCGDLLIDLKKHQISVGGEEVFVTPIEFKLIHELAVNMEKVITHERLLSCVWGDTYRNEVDYLRSFIHTIRRKIEPDPLKPRIIITIHGIGYMMLARQKEDQDGE